jgi:uncharacterized membrane protein YecN with MAPEG domain
MSKDTDAKGIPLAADHPAVKLGIPIWAFYLAFNTVITSIGLAVATFLAFPTEPQAEDKIRTLASLRLGWIYMGAWVFKITQFCLGINLGTARTESKVSVPDQQVYQVKGAAGSKLGYVLMETDGAIGRFNRAQRALQNYNENVPLFMLMFVLAGYVCPFPAFLSACTFSAGRVFSAIGYTSATDSRIPGTLLGAAHASWS